MLFRLIIDMHTKLKRPMSEALLKEHARPSYEALDVYLVCPSFFPNSLSSTTS